MNWKFHSAVAIFLISFALPVIELGTINQPQTLYGWEAALGIANMSESFTSMNWFDNKTVMIIQLIWFNMANPLILIVIIMTYAKSERKRSEVDIRNHCHTLSFQLVSVHDHLDHVLFLLWLFLLDDWNTY
jgi:hypothetical protein